MYMGGQTNRKSRGIQKQKLGGSSPQECEPAWLTRGLHTTVPEPSGEGSLFPFFKIILNRA